MRTKKALLNSLSALLQQAVAVICGFILPRLILTAFGSEVNGAVSSITQFLGYITLLEAGVGGVTRAALYKPLADKDIKTISGIANATQDFFRKLAGVFLIYSVLLAVGFKYISGTEFSVIYTGSLVLIIAISAVAQYYFGITNSIILQADQKMYISTAIQIGTIILNTIISVILINMSCGIHIVKLFSAGVFVLRPLLLNIIVKRQYHIDPKVPIDKEALKQRWNGLGQHLAYFLHNNTDIMVITIFLGLKWVSVYNIYFMVSNGIMNVVSALNGGSEAAFGNMIAKGERQVLDSRFKMMETFGACIITAFFSTTGLLIVEFVSIYTHGIHDINYNVPVFGGLLVLSQAMYCIRQQYNTLVIAAGHFKETQLGAFIEAGLNIVLAIIFVNIYGIEGVVIATIISTSYRVIDYVLYLQKHILYRNIGVFIKRILTTVANVLVIIGIYYFLPLENTHSYIAWGMKAILVFCIACLSTFFWNFIFYREDLLTAIHIIKSVLVKRNRGK